MPTLSATSVNPFSIRLVFSILAAKLATFAEMASHSSPCRIACSRRSWLKASIFDARAWSCIVCTTGGTGVSVAASSEAALAFPADAACPAPLSSAGTSRSFSHAL